MDDTVGMSLVEESPTRSPHPAGPLVVDLDGSLVRTDTMVECIMALMRQPVRLLRALCQWRHGRARLKQALAAEAMLDAAQLPYNDELVAYLKEQQAAGRVLVLATGADRRIADAVATHLDLFDQVLASDGDRNLTGSAKLAAIRQTVGTPFSYVGDSRKDLRVWCDAASGICVNTRPKVSRAAARMTTIERTFMPAMSWRRALVRALRPHQWAKNLLVFVPLAAARAIGDVHGWADALLIFVAFCCTSSGIYLINDLSDLSADRRHPNKRRRPFASGTLPLHLGLIAAPALLLVGLGLSAAVDALSVLISYALLSCAYSLWLKSRSLIDVFTLAALYGLRLLAGGAATGYHVSLWLLAFSSFLFLGLAMVKRVAELMIMPPGEKRAAAGRGYSPSDLPIVQLMGVASSFIASLVLALYVQNELISAASRRPTLSWIIVPLILFWQCRIWLATSRGEMHDDPIVFAARDWVSWVVAASCFGVLLLDNVVGTWRLAAAFW
jgi:4-hydroxybenzoate polyprenyltransferase/phosphoserine phosphatase